MAWANCDIKNLSRGSKVFFPVYVKGAGLSMADIHFSQGDGEITFCGAIEMAGYLDLRVGLIKDGMKKICNHQSHLSAQSRGTELHAIPHLRRHFGG